MMAGLEALRNNLVGANFAIPPAVLMRRGCFERAGGYDETYQWIIDWVLYSRACLLYDVGYIAEPLASHRYQHPTSESVRKIQVPRLATSEELRLFQEIFSAVSADPEWRALRRDSLGSIVDRHVSRTHRLLSQGDGERFRSELLYAFSIDRRLALRYRKMMVLWLASLFSTGFARNLDNLERGFFRALRGDSTHAIQTLDVAR
jgi:hypothetical protein